MTGKRANLLRPGLIIVILAVVVAVAPALTACAAAPAASETPIPYPADSTPTETQRSVVTVSSANSFTMLGADVSSLQRNEDLGAKYFYEDGTQGDPLQILKDHGVNFIRLRVWVNPASGANSRAEVIRFASRVKAKGLKLLIDLHYSDTWADPGKQFKPAAWADHDLDQLGRDVYDHTFDVCSSLKAVGVTPDMVQVGNEINGGMLWPTGSTDSWDNLAALLKQGINAVKDCSPSTQVMLHVANAGDNLSARIWYNAAKARGVSWDVIGLSYYSYWHGPMADMTNTIRDLKSRFDQPIVIVETSYPFTLEDADDEPNIINVNTPKLLTEGYEASPEGQAANLRDVMNAAREGGAVGVFYWEPTWTAVTGSGWDPADPNSGDQWENQALFDYSGKALPAMSEFKP